MGAWRLSDRFDPQALPLADRHYNRQKVGSPQFVPPGRCVVLLTQDQSALWVTSWPFAEYVRHAWPGAWVCSMFRNEGPQLSSVLIREAVTFVNRDKVRPKRDPGRCFLRAGFKAVGETKGGLVALQLLPCDMPEPDRSLTRDLFTADVA